MQKIRSDYYICPLCGAALDIGERCDCETTEINTPATPKTDFIYIGGYKCRVVDKMENMDE